jgi:hypothetical protein
MAEIGKEREKNRNRERKKGIKERTEDEKDRKKVVHCSERLPMMFAQENMKIQQLLYWGCFDVYKDGYRRLQAYLVRSIVRLY